MLNIYNFLFLVIFSILSTQVSYASSVGFYNDSSPITVAERTAATNELIALLKDTNYFQFINSRVHGLPENNAYNSFWYSNMWTGVKVKKADGKIYFTHQNNGSDNVGIHTSPYLEGACYAYALTGDQKYAQLARKLIRGFSAWILSSSRSDNDSPKILTRSFYPDSFSIIDNGTEVFVDYSASRPGVNSEPSSYVNVPNNPHFGNIWIKNLRSIDDIGHMIRAIAQIQNCKNIFDEKTKQDLIQLNELYSKWALSVEKANFIIPTFNLNSEIYLPKFSISDYNLYAQLGFDPNCNGKLAISLLHKDSSLNLNCRNGISNLEILFQDYLQTDAVEILRSQHIAALAMAKLKSLPTIVNNLKKGLAERINRDFEFVKNAKRYPKRDIQDVPTFFIHANNVGVSLTPSQTRFIYKRLHEAYLGMRAPAYFPIYHLFESTVPDGVYSYDAPNIGLYFYTLGPMLGTCSSAYRQENPKAQIFDCEKIRKAL